jgi:riboflavin kinase/FMN adenylyltransferase
MRRHSILPIAAKKTGFWLGLLGQMGPARVIHIRFDDALRSTGADQFVSDILAGLGVRQLYAGTDFAFGKGRGGDLQTINQVGKPLGISATAVPLLVDANTAVISSSRIRAALQAGVPDAAAAMLGHDWAVTGTVIKGRLPRAHHRLSNRQYCAWIVAASRFWGLCG